MGITQSILLAIEALRANKVRSGLTTLGVIIGVTSVILLVAIGQGTKAYITESVSSMGTNLLTIHPGKMSSKGMHPPMGGTTRKLTYDDAMALKRRIPTIEEVVAMVTATATVKYGKLSWDVLIAGASEGLTYVRHLQIANGRDLTYEDVASNRKVAIIGTQVVKELFHDENPLGKPIIIANSKFRVIGVLEHKGQSLGINLDEIVIIPVKTAQSLFDITQLHQIWVQVKQASQIPSTIDRITEYLKKRHQNEEDFTIQSQDAMLSTLDTILNVLTGVLGGIAAISLIVGGIGIMNIMLVSVRERTREIGIRKAIGATYGNILSQFLIESITLSALGGIIGILLGFLCAAIVSKAFSNIPTQVTWWSVILAFAVSGSLGVFFGVYPAHRAATLDPIVALRYE